MLDGLERMQDAARPWQREIPGELLEQDHFLLALFLLAGSPDFYYSSELQVDNYLGDLQPGRITTSSR